MKLPGIIFDRFWSRVDAGEPDVCWPWLGCVDKAGYGHFRLDTRTSGRAHRVAWELTNDRSLKGLDGLHSCDVRHCCNPLHIRPGTQADNNADMRLRGRQWSKLTTDQVRELRRQHAAGVKPRVLQELFGIKAVQVWRIAKRQRWAKL